MAEHDAQPGAWGQAREMNGLEALMWRAEGDPRLRSTISSLELLDCTPDWDRFLAAHDWATRLVPRFRQRVVEPALGVGVPSWVVDRNFDLHYHVRRVGLPPGSVWTDALALAEQLAMVPFDRSRSPWEATLIEGLPDGKSAFLLKLHHATTDGLGAVQLLGMLHSSRREPSPEKPQVSAPEFEYTTPTNLFTRQLTQDAAALPALGARHAAGLVRSVASPERSLRAAVRFTASLRRVLADPDSDGSPLLAGRSLSWRFMTMDIPFAPLRAASKTVGGSLNDAFVAALLGGFRRYHDELGVPVDSMPIAIPISVRKADDPEGGNAFAGARLAAPVGVVDPQERMRIIGLQVAQAREEPAVAALGLIAPALSRLPAPVISQLAGGLTKANDLQASNVPGIREDRYVAGARIERAYGFGPLPGCATMITLVSHGDLCCIGINVDPAAITDLERFERCLREGFDEVLALAS
ncbi:Putative diacylglycerol O-acyltransferase [Paraconexibacter sp. AEG42_29]|uniref:diacylglycerol O-acyltransferase n=1 Tax=Paraconexibacter sp. AEG42_29 TaxID=2997339 RepID=A0AAU7B2F3_9ACTN